MMESSNGAMLTMPVEPAGCNNGNNGGWGGDWGAWIILFLIFGMFGWGGFGGWGGGFGGGNGTMAAYATQADLQRGFDTQAIVSKLDGINNGICNLGYDQLAQMNGINTNILQTGFGIQQSINSNTVAGMKNTNALQAQLSDCCCQTQRAIDGVNYNMAANTCAITNQMNNNTRDIIDSQNAGTRAILDYLCQEKISDLQQENQTLKLAASQAEQNNFIAANQSAQTAELIRRLGAECPTPAYVVQPPTPVNFPTNCCGQFNGGGWNNGCGQCGGCNC